MWGLDTVYKYDARRGYGAGDIKLQAEFLWQRKDLDIVHHAGAPEVIGAERRFTQDGVYIQGLYGIASRWQAGLRYDRAGLFENAKESGGTILEEYDDSDGVPPPSPGRPASFPGCGCNTPGLT